MAAVHGVGQGFVLRLMFHRGSTMLSCRRPCYGERRDASTTAGFLVRRKRAVGCDRSRHTRWRSAVHATVFEPRADWSVVPSPNNGSGVNSLTGVSCPRMGPCVAVGFYDDSHHAAQSTLIESGHGARWSIVASPNAGTSDNNFLGVSCASARWCVAVGFDKANGTYQTLIESWNGARWQIAPSPNFGTVNNILDGVSCISAMSCQAVGYHFDSTTAVQSSLVESWNGARWSIVPSPNRDLAGNILYGVSCVSASSCQAVGYAIPFNQSTVGAFETLTESWNGSGWSIVPSPNNGTSAGLLLGVSCVAANACEAVGEYANVGLANYQTLIEILERCQLGNRAQPQPRHESQ